MRCTGALCALAIVAALGGADASQAARDQKWLGKLSTKARNLRSALETAPRRDLSEHEAALSEEEVELLKEEAEEEIIMLKWATVIGIAALGATFILGFLAESIHLHWLPEAAIGVLVGMFASGLALMAHSDGLLEKEKFDFEFFMIWLLPPIIFEAGFNMNVQSFIANLCPTAFFAFIGTFASTFVVGGLVWWFGQMGLCYPLGMLAALTFGSLISATDPVTVLAVFQALGVKIDLFSMVFGESVLNDAVAIVLSRTLLSFNNPENPVDAEHILGAGKLFLIIFIGSLLIGAVGGILSSLTFKLLDLRHHDEMLYMEAALSFVFPWCAYFVAEASELSGIVSIMSCGMVMATYTRPNFSPRAVRLTARAYKVVALIAETFVFVYLGMATITFPIFTYTVWHFFFWATLACFVGRLHIYIGSFLTNCFRDATSKPPPISPAYSFVMWFSGLRGGVAFALASESPFCSDNEHNDSLAMMQARCGEMRGDAGRCGEVRGDMHTDSLAMMQATMLIACFTIFVFGGAITTICIYFDVLEPKKGAESTARSKMLSAMHQQKTSTQLMVDDGHNWLLKMLTNEQAYEKSDELRFDDDEEKGDEEVVVAEVEAELGKNAFTELKSEIMKPRNFEKGATASEMAANPDTLHAALGSPALVRTATKDAKIDVLRTRLPNLSTKDLEKLLEGAGGDVDLAVKNAKAPINTPPALL
ncbi:transmembrane Na+/H+ exchanger [Emiliania huxleyi CCMP1516]|uniref:Cation/H+ exchanger transmembrane domain-containing protein n=2 Tax=Emiliania huxleyi TaxID=2903 RepID=A0A0D3KLC7_EMIH1|nr:transmembrane Na+/H+ exchanger [Emiliania huxleyi CCMP1516]EOD36562.1 transmembrane Na+/H+ exchanger [Emiliania huxleyi CCMP1516]|eukprot:XP_005788991.1 transmembrane Na+/H+ exchanger [Emiliania huxleyi CCMP1516]